MISRLPRAMEPELRNSNAKQPGQHGRCGVRSLQGLRHKNVVDWSSQSIS